MKCSPPRQPRGGGEGYMYARVHARGDHPQVTRVPARASVSRMRDDIYARGRGREGEGVRAGVRG
jgi:hypothetical protein